MEHFDTTQIKPERPADGQPSSNLCLIILMPVFNDWQSANWVIERLDDQFAASADTVKTSVVVLDDCSTMAMPADFVLRPLKSLSCVEVLRLRRNLGHQRAIAVGLCFAYEHRPCDALVVMDGDGEDRPEDVPRLVEKFEAKKRKEIIFAARAKRSERTLFRVMYQLYKGLHWATTGFAVRVGNFSILPACSLSTLVVVGEVWNHYAAAIFKARLPHDLLPTSRGTRVSGQSRMNFIALVTHGLSAISVFSETVGVRLTAAAFGLCAVFVATLLVVVGIRVFTSWAVVGWATTAVGLLVLAVFQVLSISLGLTLFTLFSRNSLEFIPLRDYAFFVLSTKPIRKRECAGRPAET